MKRCCFIAAQVAVMLGMPFSGTAGDSDAIPLVYDVEDTGTNCPAPPLPTLGDLPLVQPLPDPFVWADWSGRSTNFADWKCRRAEIKAQIENYEIGPKPAVDPQNVTASYTNGILTVNVTVGTNTLTLTSQVFLPAGSGPFPAVIGMNSPNGSLPSDIFTSRNIARIIYYHNQVVTYGSKNPSDPYYRLYPDLYYAGQYSSWAWGVSRIIDGLEKVQDVLPIDLKHIGVTGCSYAGKMALFAGALDERVALTIAQEPGGGGAAAWRVSQTLGDVEKLGSTDHNWFMESMFQFAGGNVSRLPMDHHELCAMVAPRALLVLGNPDYTWLAEPSGYVSCRAAHEVWKTFGIPDRFGFSIVGGHSHCQLPDSQRPEVIAFVEKFLLGNTNANTAITKSPYGGIDYNRWIQWWGTGNPVFPELHLYITAVATEGDGTLVGQGSVSMSLTMADVVVNLASSDTSAVTVPASVVIPAGQSNAVFDLTIIDDSLLDGDQVATITATATNFTRAARAWITVHDNETAALSVTLPASAPESAGTLYKAGSVSIGTPVVADIPVSLDSSDPSRLIVPATTVIPTGQTSAVFSLTFVNNNVIEGSKNVSVTAHVPGWTDGIGSMTILDDDQADHFAWDAVSSPQLIGEPFRVTITAQDITNKTLDYRLPVTLSALMAGNAAGANTILNEPTPEESLWDGYEYVLGYSFTPNTNLAVTHVRHYFGDNVSIWTEGGMLLASQDVVSTPGTWRETALPNPVLLAAGVTYRVCVHENSVDYYWSMDLPATFAHGTINRSTWDYGNVFPTLTDDVRWYFVDLRYSTDVASVTVDPTSTGNFTNGVWSGDITVFQAGSNVMLQASAAAGYSYGISNPFNVLGTPRLTIKALSNSVVLSWPGAAAGFHLEQTSTLSDWTIVPVTPAVVGDRYNVTNSLEAAPVYYRLRKP